MKNWVAFPLKNYTNDQAGFDLALANNDVHQVNVDISRGSSDVMRSSLAEIEKIMKETGGSVGFGLCTEENIYASIDEVIRIEVSSYNFVMICSSLFMGIFCVAIIATAIHYWL
jgi:hypothetical protein